MREERSLQQTVKLKLSPWREQDGQITGFQVETYAAAMATVGEDRIIAIDLIVPESLFEIPHANVEVKSKLQEMLGDLQAKEV